MKKEEVYKKNKLEDKKIKIDKIIRDKGIKKKLIKKKGKKVIKDKVNGGESNKIPVKVVENNFVNKVKKIRLQKNSSEKISRGEIHEFSKKINDIRNEVGKIIIGQDKVINGLIRAFICNGHVILEGVPGIAKTLLIRALGKVSGSNVSRIQFTVDLLPTDIVGLTVYREGAGFEVIKGPVFANFIIADEINRAPPKTQSALLEAMQERQVSIGKNTFRLPKPFFVMATKNPIESAGVYSLPEAQLDRFLFKLFMDYPELEEEREIMKKNIDLEEFDSFGLKQIISVNDIIRMQENVKHIYLSKELEDYIIKIVRYTRDKENKYAKYFEWGVSPRATISFFKASKAEALMNGRDFVIPQDIKTVAFDILRHRLILSYEAEAENISADFIIDKILKEILIT